MAAEKQIKISFPNGHVQDYPIGITGQTIAKAISAQLSKKALAILVDGQSQDLSTPIVKDAALEILTWENDEAKQVFWHSSAHLIAEASQALYPHIHLGIGPTYSQWFLL